VPHRLLTSKRREGTAAVRRMSTTTNGDRKRWLQAAAPDGSGSQVRWVRAAWWRPLRAGSSQLGVVDGRVDLLLQAAVAAGRASERR
jgi:hypothetical protein